MEEMSRQGYLLEAHELALKVQEDGVWNRKDGPILMDIILCLDKAHRESQPDDEQRYQHILEELRTMDNQYGWDNLGQSEHLEDTVLFQYVWIYRWAIARGMPWRG